MNHSMLQKNTYKNNFFLEFTRYFVIGNSRTFYLFLQGAVKNKFRKIFLCYAQETAFFLNHTESSNKEL